MKVYRKVIIDIKTGKTLHEDSYEHDGPVAKCGGGGGGVSMDRSEARMNYLKIAEQKAALERGYAWDVDAAGAAPQAFTPNSAVGSMSGVTPWEAQGYNIGGYNQPGMYQTPSFAHDYNYQPGQWDLPDPYQVAQWNLPEQTWQVPESAQYDVGSYNTPGAVMPTGDWYNQVSQTGVLDALRSAYQQEGMGMLENMGMLGQVGNARSGYSGAAGAAMGSYGADVSEQLMNQAWGMMQPGLMQEAQFQQGRNQNVWQAEIEQQQYLANLKAQAARDYFGAQTQQGQWNAQQTTDRNRYMTGLEAQQGLTQAGWETDRARRTADVGYEISQAQAAAEERARAMGYQMGGQFELARSDAQTQANAYLAGQQNLVGMTDWGNRTQEGYLDYQTEYQRRMLDHETAMQRYGYQQQSAAMPYSSVLGQPLTYGSAVQNPNTRGALGGALVGGGGAMMLGATGPQGMMAAGLGGYLGSQM